MKTICSGFKGIPTFYNATYDDIHFSTSMKMTVTLTIESSTLTEVKNNPGQHKMLTTFKTQCQIL